MGDIRGGVSVSVNMEKLLELYTSNKRDTILLHAGIYLIGLFGLITFKVQSKKSLHQQLELEYQLSEEEIRFRTVSEYSYAWELWVGTEQEIRYISPSCERITGYSRDQFLDDHDLFLNIIHPDDKERYKHHQELEKNNDELGKLQFRIYHKNGDLIWIEHVCHPVVSSDGESQGRQISQYDITSEENIKEKNETLIEELTSSIENIKQLKGLLPICSHCKKVRDDSGYWEQIEEYIAVHSDASFSHGICPDCLKEYYSEYLDEDE